MTEGFVPASQLGGMLEGRRQLGMSVPALWIGYLAVGGNGTLADVTTWLSGATEVSNRDYDLLAQVVNDQFVSMGLNHPVPYSSD